VLEQGIFFTPPKPKPKPKQQPEQQGFVRLGPKPEQEKKKSPAETIEKLKKLQQLRTLNEREEETTVAGESVAYEIYIPPEQLKQLEEVASQYGLEVPEELKQSYEVQSEEEKQQVQQKLSKILDEFITEIHERQEATYKMQLLAISERTHLPVSDVGIYVVPKIVRRTVQKRPSDDINVDKLMKELRGQKFRYQQKAQEESSPYQGYRLYYEGIHELRKDLGLFNEETKKITVDVDSSQFSHPRARARGLNAHIEIDLSKEESRPQVPLYFDQTMTWEEIQKNAEAWTKIETISGAVAEAVYDEDDTNVERFIKGLGVGAVGFFTWPVDLIMTAAQWDEIQRAAAAEGKSVREFMIENIKESFKDPGTWGEITGSLLTSYGVTKLVRFTTPKVYEQKGGLSGYRQMMWEIKVDEDDIARAIRTEAFDYDELTRITVKNRIFGPKEVKVETIPQKFTAKSYESITVGDNVASTTRILEVPLGPDDFGGALKWSGEVKISQMASAGDDFMRFTETSTRILVNTDDVMNFLKQVQQGGKAPNEIIKTIGYSTDEATRTIITREIYDDIVKTSVEIKNFQDDIVKTLGKGKGKAGAGGSLDDIIKTSDDVIKPPAPGGAGGQVLQLDDALKQLDETTFKVTEKTGERILVSSGENIVIPPGWTPDIDADISKDLGDINNDINNIITGIGPGEKGKQEERQDTRGFEDTGSDEALKIITEIEQEIKSIQGPKEISHIEPEVRTKTKTKTKTIQEVKTRDILDFSLRDFYDEITEVSQAQRQLYVSLTAQLEPPKPKPKKTKIKESTKKRINAKLKKKKRTARKKKRGDEYFGWEEWIGYEDLFEI